MVREPLTKDEVIKAIERKGCGKIPLVFHKWWGKGLSACYGTKLNEMAADYPDDIFTAWYVNPGTITSSNGNPSYRWGYKEDYNNVSKHSIGENYELLPDWEELEQFLEDFPDPNEPDTFDRVEKQLPHAGGRYKLGCFWTLYHERLWAIRGMENLMIDYYENMDGLKIISRKLLEYYKVIVDRYAALGFDLQSQDSYYSSGTPARN